ncbi:hypothetical protein [Streptomyces halobius]|uniref:PH (Pleckstrin Homology) domain-containing protein n=1 Tax=Streptomyces halobius TaxID=2879846 RepID=A0ABY4MAF9_9ACTN|nr:hypothetical protein [Streptomyces halobius]UQA94760.1 hypothetical protein K9S39_25470 [Streptomyces halobius]
MNPMNEPVAPHIEQVLKHNSTLLKRHVAGRLAIGVPLLALPFVLHALGAPNSFFLVLPLPFGLWVLLFLAIRLANGLRLGVCKKVLSSYPVEYRTRVDRKEAQWLLLGTVYTVKVSSRGRQGTPRMRAVNASAVRRWPKGAENGGAWVAGDPLFGGVMIVPGSHDMLFMQPANWKKSDQERAQADSVRIVRAQQAGIAKLLEREPKVPYGA